MANKKKKLTLLAIHGFGQSREIFEKKILIISDFFNIEYDF